MISEDRLLLDTHVFLWWRQDSPRLASVRKTIARAEAVFVSSASAWEASIKMSLGRLRLPEPFSRGVVASGFQPLPVSFEHAEQIAHLPRLHRDPFDRLLICQALVERLTLVTADRKLEAYDVPMLQIARP